MKYNLNFLYEFRFIVGKPLTIVCKPLTKLFNLSLRLSVIYLNFG